jgi:hypothetical protein
MLMWRCKWVNGELNCWNGMSCKLFGGVADNSRKVELTAEIGGEFRPGRTRLAALLIRRVEGSLRLFRCNTKQCELRSMSSLIINLTFPVLN